MEDDISNYPRHNSNQMSTLLLTSLTDNQIITLLNAEYNIDNDPSITALIPSWWAVWSGQPQVLRYLYTARSMTSLVSRRLYRKYSRTINTDTFELNQIFDNAKSNVEDIRLAIKNVLEDGGGILSVLRPNPRIGSIELRNNSRYYANYGYAQTVTAEVAPNYGYGASADPGTLDGKIEYQP